MSRQNWKGSVLIAPVPPTMVTSAYDGKKNVFTVAWTGVLNTQPPKTYISVRPERYSYELIKNSGEFVINLTTTGMVKNADRCGTYSGR
ncbi:MAG: flavin reductase, partial [Clostridia bacterium]|nr:flavin reductase [Clostridia bacterium]